MRFCARGRSLGRGNSPRQPWAGRSLGGAYAAASSTENSATLGALSKSAQPTRFSEAPVLFSNGAKAEAVEHNCTPILPGAQGGNPQILSTGCRRIFSIQAGREKSKKNQQNRRFPLYFSPLLYYNVFIQYKEPKTGFFHCAKTRLMVQSTVGIRRKTPANCSAARRLFRPYGRKPKPAVSERYKNSECLNG